MKTFTLVVVVFFLSMFGLSLRETPTEPQNVLDYTVYWFNDTVLDVCYPCGVPSEPYVEQTSDGNYTTTLSVSVIDNRMTQTSLANTFWAQVFFIGSVNLAFYAGRGDIRRLLGKVVEQLREIRKKDIAAVEAMKEVASTPVVSGAQLREDLRDYLR